MAQYDQLLLFYNQLINMADEIKELIDKELFDDIMNKIQTHDRLLIQIKLAKKCTKLNETETKEIDKLEEELKEKEQRNIKLLQTNMATVKTELDGLKLKTKIKKAYGQIASNDGQGSIIDIDDTYRQ